LALARQIRADVLVPNDAFTILAFAMKSKYGSRYYFGMRAAKRSEQDCLGLRTPERPGSNVMVALSGKPMRLRRPRSSEVPEHLARLPLTCGRSDTSSELLAPLRRQTNSVGVAL
jgi:hypothetical protein